MLRRGPGLRKQGSLLPLFFASENVPRPTGEGLKMAPGIDSRLAFTLPFFSTDILAIVIPTLSISPVTLIFGQETLRKKLAMLRLK